MMVLAAGLAKTGAIDILGSLVARLAGASEIRFIAVLLAITVPASAFINNTPVVIVLLPLVLGFAHQHGVAASRLLLPLSYGAQLGGTLTLIGTSTNLLVASLILDMGLPRLSLFDITPVAVPLVLIGVAYLLTVGRWLTPSRASEASLVARYELREYLTAVTVEENAPIAGKTLAQSNFGQRLGLHIVAITRGKDRISIPGGLTRIEAGDVLLVEGKVRDIANLEKTAGLRIAGARPELLASGVEPDFAEVLVPPRSRVIGRSLRDLGFRARYGLAVLALQRHAEPVHEALGAIPLEAGDILLAYGPPEALHALHRSGDMALLGSLELPARRGEKLSIAVAIVLIVILLAALGVTSILIASLLGAIAMTLTGCLRPDEAYRDMDWMVLVLLAAIIPLGLAMQNTGAAAFLASQIMILTEPLGPYGTLAAFYLFTSLLTEIMSNNAAAVMLTPTAIAVATALQVSPMPFVVATMFAASNAFMTPIGYQTNMFIYGPGGYTFADFARVGGPLNLLLVVAATVVIPLVFPF
jgi:di/tricarboxylate transporter